MYLSLLLHFIALPHGSVLAVVDVGKRANFGKPGDEYGNSGELRGFSLVGYLGDFAESCVLMELAVRMGGGEEIIVLFWRTFSTEWLIKKYRIKPTYILQNKTLPHNYSLRNNYFKLLNSEYLLLFVYNFMLRLIDI